MDVRVHTAGRITTGEYKDWYVFVQTYGNSDNYLILLANNATFGKNEDGKLIEGAKGYGSWMPDRVSLENHFEVKGWQVEWLPDVVVKRLKNEAE